MDEMRAMLDDLMGKHRDVPLTEREKFVYAAYFFACIHSYIKTISYVL